MMNKEGIKDRNRLELALDHETRQLISFIAYNWDAAASRMEQIANEREQGLYDDDGTEAIRFAVWFAERCLYYQLKIYGDKIDALHNDSQKVGWGKGNFRYLEALPVEFTKEDLVNLRIANGESPVVKTIICRWVKEGLVVKIGSNLWRKVG